MGHRSVGHIIGIRSLLLYLVVLVLMTGMVVEMMMGGR